MSFWTYANLADVTQGRWLVAPEDLQAAVAGLWHDTRELEPGQAYLAIQGENFDGHDFVNNAFDAGATLAIVQSGLPGAGGRVPTHPVLQVSDTVKALQDLARAYRDELKAGGCKVIGVAGSNGKTTTRHLIHHVLTHAGLAGTQSPKSFNNHLGVPLTLLQARPEHGFVACEIGTNRPGEIDFLSAIARPDIAVITSIGEEHLEFFKTIRGVAKEEASILPHIAQDGAVVCPEHDWQRYVSRHCERDDLTVTHGLYAPRSDEASGVLLGLPAHQESNLQLACAVATLRDVTIETIDDAVLTIQTPVGRGELFEFGPIKVIHDAYNANPSSTIASLDLFDRFPDRRRVMVLGDMLELGEQAIDAHTSVGIRAETANVDHLITIGGLANHAAMSAEDMRTDCFDRWTDDLPDQVADLLQPGDTVLLKASRGMRLERLIPAIERRFGPAQGNEPT